jgi:MFS family permease
MPAAENAHTAQQSKRFLYLYALAVSGGAVAYVPFLTILLPSQATALWGKDALSALAQAAFAGAIAASIANILFGWASDRFGSRRPWIVTGLVLSSALLPAMQMATSPAMLIAMIICWQICLNMMLAPLTAWAGDTVPDSQKGRLGGLLSFAPALGALSGALITFPGLAGQTERLFLVSLLVVLMVAPVLILGRPYPMPQLADDRPETDSGMDQTHTGRGAVLRMWLARLFVQIAEASLFAFLLLWFRSVTPDFGENDAATIFALVLAVSVVATLIIGRWSDRADRPILPLGICAAISGIGLLIMSAAGGVALAIAGYAIFGFASGIFLALHSSQTLRVLPTPKTRGRDLGLFNLTNTVPSLIMPWLTLAMVPTYGFDALFVLLAGLTMVAAILLITIPCRNLL